RADPHSPTPPFPTRRSSDLPGLALRQVPEISPECIDQTIQGLVRHRLSLVAPTRQDHRIPRSADLLQEVSDKGALAHPRWAMSVDRKSTRLNSSHVKISYAV